MGVVSLVLIVMVVCGVLVAVLYCMPSRRHLFKKYSKHSKHSEDDIVFPTPSLVLVEDIVQKGPSDSSGELASGGHGSESPSTVSTEFELEHTVPNRPPRRESIIDDVEFPDDYLFSHVFKV